MTSLTQRWSSFDNWCHHSSNPRWLVDSLMPAITSLPKLIEFDIVMSFSSEIHIPSGLLKLRIIGIGGDFRDMVSAAILNSPGLRTLELYLPHDNSLGTIFSSVSLETPLCLEHLRVNINATLDQRTLPHLACLNSFEFAAENEDISQETWRTFLVHKIKLSRVAINGFVTKETMLYLSSFSGLRQLKFGLPWNVDRTELEHMFYEEVLPKHSGSLEELDLTSDLHGQCVKLTHLFRGTY
jgi:hypothetical protein